VTHFPHCRKAWKWSATPIGLINNHETLGFIGDARLLLDKLEALNG